MHVKNKMTSENKEEIFEFHCGSQDETRWTLSLTSDEKAPIPTSLDDIAVYGNRVKINFVYPSSGRRVVCTVAFPTENITKKQLRKYIVRKHKRIIGEE